MPTTYAHYRLGGKVTEQLPSSAKETVLKYRELFDIGVHGPDIFFYHNPLLKSDIVRLGEQMHHEAAAVFFKRAAAIVRKQEQEYKEAQKAYLYGFLCHFALDVTCHGYIGEQIEKTGIGHFEIEAELDRELLEKDGYIAVSKCLTKHLHASDKNADVIAGFWQEVSKKQARQTLKRMIFFLNVLRAPSKLKRSILFGVMKLAGVYELLHGLVINYKENTKCRETTDWLLAHFDEAVNLAVSLITEFENHIQTGKSLSDQFNYDFESEKKQD